MGATERLKAVHRWTTERWCGNRIVFHHVPKCAGTSVARSLRRAYLPSQGTVKPDESVNAFRAWRTAHPKAVGRVSDFNEMMLLYLLYCDVRCVAAHVPFSAAAFENFRDTYVFVTILRDPVERFISNYHWSNSRPQGHRSIPLPLEQYLETPEAVRMGSTYVRYFCGRPGQDRYSRGDIAAAIANLRRMNCVGFLDQMGKFEADLNRLTGRRLSIGQENVRGTSTSREAIMTGALREKVLAVCAADREVWDAVQDLREAESKPAKMADPGARLSV